MKKLVLFSYYSDNILRFLLFQCEKIKMGISWRTCTISPDKA
ncbi:hypothetical protein HMPREF0322_05088 [Desulfitobacterium hafniense DP7]|uniref:Uncharacterized protein n=1 Tax=Desulfitobacterium hafniense DP7 TaxID=537010 RepID=G9XVQ5_DESHA|nr:hypothetical protein HMPREF0322_05088 [Desulfitobacterium hafniense DP7]